jgi:phosphoserine phosphatase RsbU/P
MANEPHTLQCSEVWGGNEEAERAIVMRGLDAWVLSRPANGDAGGGDIHYLSSCATGRITRILLADVSGHGAEVAGLALRLRTLMRRFVNYVDQRRLVERLNQEFAAAVKNGRFATAIVATLWGPTGVIEVTNAGHPTPLVYRVSGGVWRRLETDGSQRADDLPLGVQDGTTYGRARVLLERGDMLLLYTDALIEAKLPDGSYLGEEGLLRVLREVATPAGDAAGLTSRIAARVCELAACDKLDDDATLLLLKPNDLPPPRGSLALGLATGARLMKELVRAVFRRESFARPELNKENFVGVFYDPANRR